jgi:hypothetical protein
MLLIDAHVHIYDCFDLEKFFDSAYANFKSEAEQLSSGKDFTGILLLAETSKDNWFTHLANYADGNNLPDKRTTGSWNFRNTDENYSLIAESGGPRKLILVAGRQVITAEGLEVLALCTSDTFNDGEPILDLIREIEEKDGVAVIPWGVGKWFGYRGKIVKNIINNNNSLFYLGDNRNRPDFWPRPTLFKLAKQKGIGVLAGSDPLPFNSESFRAGSYGFSTKRQIDPKRPGKSIKQILRDGADITASRFGRLENNYRFLLNQMRMQIAKRQSTTGHD